MEHPYTDLPDSAYWKLAISERNPLELEGLYEKRFEISPTAAVATAGSCFAQHIGHQLKARGFGFLDVEPPPRLLPPEEHGAFGYGIYSARFGNIYSAGQLLQLFLRAFGRFEPADEVWEHEGRFYDPFRPSIEPNGFGSREEVLVLRERHLAAVRRLFEEAEVFVFTFGLTESWIAAADSAVYPTCPGTVAGEFDPEQHLFKNFSFPEILDQTSQFIEEARAVRPGLKFLFTISPVPLTATASGNHVLPATIYSKSVLRAVVGELVSSIPDVDYFPSFELVASHPMRAMFFEPNLRAVSPAGVELVMEHFFRQHPSGAVSTRQQEPEQADEGDVICDELALEPEVAA